MEINMVEDIKSWEESTKKIIQELYDLLVTDVGMTRWDAHKYIEKVYYAIASELGD